MDYFEPAPPTSFANDKHRCVSIVSVGSAYCKRPPFHPARKYPENPFSNFKQSDRNPAYEGIRSAFRLLAYDIENYSKPAWNPLGFLIHPGDVVLIKPNLIRESHLIRQEEWTQVITHGSVIRAILDFVFISLKGEGKVIIADGPQTDSNFEKIVARTGLSEIVEFYTSQGLDIELLDLRRDRWLTKDGIITKREKLPGDPQGYTKIELGHRSEFSTYELSGHFYGADYDIKETKTFHSSGRHGYILCKSALNVDVVINIPKLKTHKKTGVTLSLKNIVGVNGYRNCLPHFTMGTPDEGGDEFPSSSVGQKFQSQAIQAFKKTLFALGGKGGLWARIIKSFGQLIFGGTQKIIRSGNWYGNETAWRMVLDINKILFHFDGDGKARSKPLRYLTVVDGIEAGDGNGPEAPDRVDAGCLLVGINPVSVDTVCSTLMGFDYRKIPVVSRAWTIQDFPLVDFPPEDVNLVSNVTGWSGTISNIGRIRRFNFRPHFGWQGHIELPK